MLVGTSGGAGASASLGLIVGAVGALGTLVVSAKRVGDVESDPFVSLLKDFFSFLLFDIFSLFPENFYVFFP